MKNLFLLLIICFSYIAPAQTQLSIEAGQHHWTEHHHDTGDLNYDFATVAIRYRPNMHEIEQLFIEASVQYQGGSYGALHVELMGFLRVPSINIKNGPSFNIFIAGAGLSYDSWQDSADFKAQLMSEIYYKRFYLRGSVNTRLMEAVRYDTYLYWDIGIGYQLFKGYGLK